METQTQYPQFFRKAGHCLKRESETTGTEIRIPDPEDPEAMLPLVHQPIHKSKSIMDEEVGWMEKVNQEVYEDYLADFFKASERNRKKYNDYRQRKFETRTL